LADGHPFVKHNSENPTQAQPFPESGEPWMHPEQDEDEGVEETIALDVGNGTAHSNQLPAIQINSALGSGYATFELERRLCRGFYNSRYCLCPLKTLTKQNKIQELYVTTHWRRSPPKPASL
jgi:hypothetical protein